MIEPGPALDARALESLLAFWRDAGVADSFEDAPQDRLTAGAERMRSAAPPPDAPAAAAVALPDLAPDGAQAIAAAREAALAADSLEALSAAIESFEGSALRFCGARRAAVMRGPAQPRLMVIGEAPGADEDREGRPYAGQAGALLDRALAAAGLKGRALLTYTVFWRPPGDRAVKPEEQAVLEPFLDRMIALAQPKALLVLGAAAARAVLREEGSIMALRGRWFERTSDDGATKTPAWASFSPSFLLRQPGTKKLFWADLLALTGGLQDHDQA